MIALLFLLSAFPQGSVVVEAESFEVISRWTVTMARAETAVGGLGESQALNSNQADALARKELSLPTGRYTVWVRGFDWGGAPGHYGFQLDINGVTKRMAMSEPVVGGFVWDRWGVVDGGDLNLGALTSRRVQLGVRPHRFRPRP